MYEEIVFTFYFVNTHHFRVVAVANIFMEEVG